MSVRIRIDLDSVIAPIDERIYGSFIEHMGRAVYTGIYEPDHPTADEFGFRRDVMDLIRPLGLAHIRYPGGNFLSGYDWRDGIGPREGRPVRLDAAWFALEPNLVGTDDFLQYCERLGTSAMMGVNLGTGTPADAAALLEYVNGDLPTALADKRRANGREKPYGVKLWCLGNEMDGPWQICAKTAEEYGRVACETAKLMKWIDPGIELVVCGSSYRTMPTFGEWERTVLKHCYQYVDYISLHQYYENENGDVPSFLARSIETDEFIREVAGFCAEAKREFELGLADEGSGAGDDPDSGQGADIGQDSGQGAGHDVYLSFDEWNVWYHFRKAGNEPPKWTVGRPIEEEAYDGADALLVGLMLNTLLRNADVVKIACLAQLVNVIAPIMTEPGGGAWVQSIYYPFLYVSRYGRGESLSVDVTGGTYDCAIREGVPFVDCAAVKRDDGEIVLFLVNRDSASTHTCSVEIGRGGGAVGESGGDVGTGAPNAKMIEWLSMPCAGEAQKEPVRVEADLDSGADMGSRNNDDKRPAGMALNITLPAFSWNMVRFGK